MQWTKSRKFLPFLFLSFIRMSKKCWTEMESQCYTHSIVYHYWSVCRKETKLGFSGKNRWRPWFCMRLCLRALESLWMHPTMNGVRRCMFMAWMKRHPSGLWQSRDFSTVLVSRPSLNSRNYTSGWQIHKQRMLILWRMSMICGNSPL